MVTVMVLRGYSVDKEVLICGDVLKDWRLLHPSFPNQTIDQYIKFGFKGEIKCVKFYLSLIQNEAKINTPPLHNGRWSKLGKISDSMV